MRLNSSRNRQQGFTLIEIMVVVIIIGILAAMVAPRVLGRVDQARVTAAQSTIDTINGAVTLYRMDNFSYPKQEHGLDALVTPPNDPSIKNWNPEGYLDALPVDPWGNPYQYLNPGNNGPIDIYSFGADGKEGGEGYDADIGNWTQE